MVEKGSYGSLLSKYNRGERMIDFKGILDSEDSWIVENCGFGARRGFGKSPALLIIDAQYNFTGEDLPVKESMNIYPSGIGEGAWESVKQIELLLLQARENRVPVIYTRAVRSDIDVQFDSFRKKRKTAATKILHNNTRGVEIVDNLKPLDDELVIDKKYASGFFGTPLETILRSLGIDTLIVTGFVTSGCIRATVVDAASYNYNVIIPKECVNDRISISHKVNLLDMDLKYADVTPVNEVLEFMKEVRNEPAY
jgi:maleamate amidohydrolase